MNLHMLSYLYANDHVVVKFCTMFSLTAVLCMGGVAVVNRYGGIVQN